MKKLYTLFFIAIAMMLFLPLEKANAQVTIGSREHPSKGALLDLKQNGNAAQGLVLPRVELKDLSKLIMSDLEIANTNGKYKDHTGLMVYNLTEKKGADKARICPGIHIWDGKEWTPMTAYPQWPDAEEVLVGFKASKFVYLSPDQPLGWPAGRVPSDYKLGPLAKFKDNRPGGSGSEYTTTRYYVGYYLRTAYYETRTSHSCDPEKPEYIVLNTREEVQQKFDDGVWMSENLRETVMPNGTAISVHTAANKDNPQYIHPNKATTTNNKYGLLYNFAAASNGAKPANIDEGANVEGLEIQGICPEGWILPSDREWTDLENAITRETRRFSTTNNIWNGNESDWTPLAYGASGTSSRGKHGGAMKSKTAIIGGATAGTSLAASAGGFEVPLVGYIQDGTVKEYGDMSTMWTSSTGSSNNAYGRTFFKVNAGGTSDPLNVIRYTHDRKLMNSVRCKRIIPAK